MYMGKGCEVLLICRSDMEQKQAPHQLGQKRLGWGQTGDCVFQTRGRVFVITWCISPLAWKGEDGGRQGSGEEIQTQIGGPMRSEEVETIHASFDLAEFVQSPKKPVLLRLVGVMEEETAVMGPLLFLSCCPPPKGLQAQVRKASLKASEAQKLGSRRLELDGRGIKHSPYVCSKQPIAHVVKILNIFLKVIL